MSTPSDNAVEGMFNIKDQSAYMPGFVATGMVAIIQTVTPLLLAQLWKKNDLDMDVNNPWYSYAWKAMQSGGVVAFGL